MGGAVSQLGNFVESVPLVGPAVQSVDKLAYQTGGFTGLGGDYGIPKLFGSSGLDFGMDYNQFKDTTHALGLAAAGAAAAGGMSGGAAVGEAGAAGAGESAAVGAGGAGAAEVGGESGAAYLGSQGAASGAGAGGASTIPSMPTGAGGYVGAEAAGTPSPYTGYSTPGGAGGYVGAGAQGTPIMIPAVTGQAAGYNAGQASNPNAGQSMGMNSNASAADVYNNPDFYGQPNAAATTGGATATGAPVAAGAARGAMSPWVMPGMMGLGAIANIYGSKQQANAMEDMQANNMAAYQQYGIRYPDAATIQAQTNQGMSGLAEMMLKNNQASTENMAARGLGGPAVGNQINQNYMNYLQSLGKFQNQMAVTANTPVSTSSVPYQNQPYPTVGGGLSNMAGGLTGTIGGIGMYDYLRNSSLFA